MERNRYMRQAIYSFCLVILEFILALPDELFDKLKKSGTSKYIKSLKEMNVDFTGKRFIK
jgi:hypothetical protein